MSVPGIVLFFLSFCMWQAPEQRGGVSHVIRFAPKREAKLPMRFWLPAGAPQPVTYGFLHDLCCVVATPQINQGLPLRNQRSLRRNGSRQAVIPRSSSREGVSASAPSGRPDDHLWHVARPPDCFALGPDQRHSNGAANEHDDAADNEPGVEAVERSRRVLDEPTHHIGCQ